VAQGLLPNVSYVDPAFDTEGNGTSADDHPLADIRLGEGPGLCLPAPLLPVSAAELHHPGASSHVSSISHPEQVTRLILVAAHAVSGQGGQR
jgi:hypothetical protein